jgi:hypothetical protein
LKKFAAEFTGTFALVFAGASAIVMNLESPHGTMNQDLASAFVDKMIDAVSAGDIDSLVSLYGERLLWGSR